VNSILIHLTLKERKWQGSGGVAQGDNVFYERKRNNSDSKDFNKFPSVFAVNI
jgi:hypothetical protein